MHATIFGQISPEFPFVTLGAQTETGYIFNEAVSGGHSCSSSTTTTTLCCRLVTISAWSWWSEKKNNQMSRFPERKPSDECFCPFAYAARCHTPSFVSSACPICCLRHVQHAIFPNTPPPIETPWMWRIFMLIVCFSQTGLRWWSNSRLSSHQWEHSKEVSLTVTFTLTLYYQLNILCPVPTIH